MNIEKGGAVNPISSAIRTGLVEIARQNCNEGEVIFVPTPWWVPEDGHTKLVPVTVKQISDGVAMCEDANQEPWALWL